MELGILLTLVAALGWGSGDVFARKAMFGAPAELVLAVMVTMVVVALGIVGMILEGAGAFTSMDATFFALVALMGLLSWITGNLFYFHGMKRATVVIAAPILGVAPLISILLAVVFGGERPGAATVVGAFVIVIGVVVLVSDRNRVEG